MTDVARVSENHPVAGYEKKASRARVPGVRLCQQPLIPRPHFVRRFSLTQLILSALVAGIIFGSAFRTAGASLIELARLFVRVLQLLVIPLVVCTLALGIGRTAHNSALGRLTLGALGYFILGPLIAIFIGLVAGNVIQDFLPAVPVGEARLAPPSSAESPRFIDTLIPTSVVGAMAANNLLGVVFFTVVFALALRSIRADLAAPILQLLEGVAAVMLKLTSSVMWLTPIAVFAAAAAAVATAGWSRAMSFLVLIVTCYVALATFGTLLLIVSSRLGRFNGLSLLRAVSSPLLLAFSTASSAAGLPGAIDALERWGASRRVTGFLLPLGFSFNLTGTAVYLPLCVLFWAGVNGVKLSAADQAMLGLSVFLLIRGLPPIPRGLFLVLGGILAQFGLPPEGILILLGIDPLLDMARTGMNLGGNCLMVATLNRLDAPAVDTSNINQAADARPKPVDLLSPHA